MASSWIAGYRDRVRQGLRLAFAEDHPPHLVATSFSVGIFLTALPSLGLAVAVLAWIGYQVDRANRLAFLAAVSIMNPFAKTGVYLASFVVGSILLGPIPGITRGDVGLSAGPDVLARLLLGNAILAVAFAAVAYALAYRGALAYRRRRAASGS